MGTLAFISAHVNFFKYPPSNHLVVMNHLVGLLASIRRLVTLILTTTSPEFWEPVVCPPSRSLICIQGIFLIAHEYS